MAPRRTRRRCRMFRFVLGVVVGFALAAYVKGIRPNGEVERRASELLDRANGVLTESRRVLDDARRQ